MRGMKRCPTCQSTYTDNSLVFCLTDGAALVGAGAFDPRATLPEELQTTLRDENRATLRDDNQETLPYPPARGIDPQSISPAPQSNIPPGGWNPPPAWTPLTPHSAQALRQQNLTPWIIGAASAFILAVVITIIAVNSTRTAPGGNANVVAIEGNTNNEVINSNSSKPSRNKNKNSTDLDADAPPTEPEVVLSQLTALEYEWNDANIKGNKAAVRRIVADEFRGVGADGKVANKEQMLADLHPAPQIASLKLSDLKVSLAGNTAVLTGLNTVKSKEGQVISFRFTDTFLWREGRWQAISSQASQVR